ncbi:hypothetical protein [Helicobacter sp. 23-1045]
MCESRAKILLLQDSAILQNLVRFFESARFCVAESKIPPPLRRGIKGVGLSLRDSTTPNQSNPKLKANRSHSVIARKCVAFSWQSAGFASKAKQPSKTRESKR